MSFLSSLGSLFNPSNQSGGSSGNSGNNQYSWSNWSPQQMTLLQQLLGNATQSLTNPQKAPQQGPGGYNSIFNQAIQGTQSFLPGGGGFAPIQADVTRNFNQQVLPGILERFGANNKGSSALNQAISSGSNDLNSSLASLQAQYGLGAANQLGNLAQQGQQIPGFSFGPQGPQQKPKSPTWKDRLFGGLAGAGSGFLSGGGPLGALLGGLGGALRQ